MALAIWQKFHQQTPAPVILEQLFGNDDATNLVLSQNILFDLFHLGTLSVSGPDAAKFLQGQLTCDIKEVNSIQSRLGAHCNPKGRILSSFRIFQQHDLFYLAMPSAMVPIAINHLQKYAMFSKVHIENSTEHMLGISCAGPHVNELLQEILGDKQLMIDELLQYDALSIIRVPDQVANYRYEIYGEPTTIYYLWEKLTTRLSPVSNEIWQLLNINAGIPTIYPETSGLFTPHMINFQLLNGISFNKGCYTGQEIVARMQYLGKLKQHLYRAWIGAGATPQYGDTIFAADNPTHPIGSVVNAFGNPTSGYFMLITLQNDAITSNNLIIGAKNNAYLKILV